LFFKKLKIELSHDPAILLLGTYPEKWNIYNGIYTMEYYSAIKRNKTGSFAEMWMHPEAVIQSEVREKQIPCINTSMWNLEKMV